MVCASLYVAIYANHSSKPNARLETWPVLNPGPFELRQHMVIVATEEIQAGAEGLRQRCSSRAPDCVLARLPLIWAASHPVLAHQPTAPLARAVAVRINYEDGNELYWGGAAPSETDEWRRVRLRPPPPTAETEPVLNRLAEIQMAAVLKRDAPACPFPRMPTDPAPWGGGKGWDARLQTVVAFLSANGLDPVSTDRWQAGQCWPIVSTHLP